MSIMSSQSARQGCSADPFRIVTASLPPPMKGLNRMSSVPSGGTGQSEGVSACLRAGAPGAVLRQPVDARPDFYPPECRLRQDRLINYVSDGAEGILIPIDEEIWRFAKVQIKTSPLETTVA